MSNHNDHVLHDLHDLQQVLHDAHASGKVINENLVQPALDALDIGAGPAGDAYLSAINEYGDPLPVVEAISDALDFLAGDCE